MLRRQFIQTLGIGATVASTTGYCATQSKVRAKIVIIGGGFGGATAAKYLRLWGGDSVAVTLIEPHANFISCPLSNLIIGGSLQIADITLSYEILVRRYAVQLVHDHVKVIDADKRSVLLGNGSRIPYDRLIVSPGIDFMWAQLPGMLLPGAQDKVLHAWKAGSQTVALRKQLLEMPDGGTFVLSIPKSPFRCPPGPYERVCQVAHYFRLAKKKSKIIVLDANDDIISKRALFKQAWDDRYREIIEYVPQFLTADVDILTNTVISDFGEKVHGTVLNVIPPQQAGGIAAQAGLANVNQRWCEVNFLNFESTQAKNIYVLGDAIQTAPLMPKSGHMANQHAKVCVAAILDSLSGKELNREALMTNTCYSFVSDRAAMHVASVHAYSAAQKTMLAVPNAGGVSSKDSELEGEHALSWASNIWADTLG